MCEERDTFVQGGDWQNTKYTDHQGQTTTTNNITQHIFKKKIWYLQKDNLVNSDKFPISDGIGPDRLFITEIGSSREKKKNTSMSL